MPLLVAVPASLVAFAFYESKHNAVGIPLNAKNVRVHKIFRSRHQVPLEAQKSTRKNELFPFLLQKKLANLFVDIETHLLLINYTHVPLNYLLVSNVMPDALRELLEVLEEIRIHSIIAYPKQMLEHTRTLLVR